MIICMRKEEEVERKQSENMEALIKKENTEDKQCHMYLQLSLKIH